MEQNARSLLLLLLLHLLPLLIAITSTPAAATAAPVRALVAPITKHLNPTSFYTLSFANKNLNYLLDLSGPFLWSACPKSHPTLPCNSTTCALAYTSPRRHCPHPQNKPLHHYSSNSGTCACKVCGSSDLTRTDLTLSSTDGHTPTGPVTAPGLVSACSPAHMGPAGVAGLSSLPLSLPTQLSSSLSTKSQFALCLPSTSSSPGVAFFGGGPFHLLPPGLFDISSKLSHTPLLKNPKNPSGYYINLQGIAIGGTHVSFLSRVLSFDSLGHGGVQLSTAAPYTTLMTHIYAPFLRAFARATRGVPRVVPPVGPFGLCLNSTALGSTRVGYGGVPQVDLMLPGGKNWSVFGANSMKQVGEDTACLAFVDGGRRAEKAVVVGAYQMEDNFLLFDAGRSSLGFSSSLLFFRTNCGNFNFTPSPTSGA